MISELAKRENFTSEMCVFIEYCTIGIDFIKNKRGATLKPSSNVGLACINEFRYIWVVDMTMAETFVLMMQISINISVHTCFGKELCIMEH